MSPIKRTKTRDRWVNIIRYITSIQDQIEYHDLNDEEIAALEKKRLEWLEYNFQITPNQRTLKKLRVEGKL